MKKRRQSRRLIPVWSQVRILSGSFLITPVMTDMRFQVAVMTTEAGENAGLVLKFPKNMTVCELDGKTLFEIHRDGAAAISARAELYAPDGVFVKCPVDLSPQLFFKGSEIKIGGVVMSQSTIEGWQIGIWIRKDGRIVIGVNR